MKRILIALALVCAVLFGTAASASAAGVAVYVGGVGPRVNAGYPGYGGVGVYVGAPAVYRHHHHHHRHGRARW